MAKAKARFCETKNAGDEHCDLPAENEQTPESYIATRLGCPFPGD